MGYFINLHSSLHSSPEPNVAHFKTPASHHHSTSFQDNPRSAGGIFHPSPALSPYITISTYLNLRFLCMPALRCASQLLVNFFLDVCHSRGFVQVLMPVIARAWKIGFLLLSRPKALLGIFCQALNPTSAASGIEMNWASHHIVAGQLSQMVLECGAAALGRVIANSC